MYTTCLTSPSLTMIDLLDVHCRFGHDRSPPPQYRSVGRMRHVHRVEFSAEIPPPILLTNVSADRDPSCAAPLVAEMYLRKAIVVFPSVGCWLVYNVFLHERHCGNLGMSLQCHSPCFFWPPLCIQLGKVMYTRSVASSAHSHAT